MDKRTEREKPSAAGQPVVDGPGPVCRNCGSPWFEPAYGALFCCDCDTQLYGPDPITPTEGQPE